MKTLFSGLLAGLLLSVLTVTSGFSQSQEGISPVAEAYYHFSIGRTLEADGDWEGALDEYEQALAIDPTNSAIYSEMASSYFRHQQVRDAIDYAERAIRANNDNLDAHQLLSSIYTGLLSDATEGRGVAPEIVDRAIEELEEVVRLDPTERDAYLMLGRLYRFRDEPERAAQVYRDILEISPGSEEGAISLAELQLESGNVNEAIEILREFSENQPDSRAVLALLGESYIRAENWGDAATAYTNALVLDPEDADFLREAARALLISGRLDEAVQRYEELIALEPNDPIAHLRLGQIERQQMNFEIARVHLEEAARLVPNSPEIQFDLALLERDEGNFEESLTELEQLLADTERPNGRYTEGERGNRRIFMTNVALLQTRLESYDDAVDTFEQMKSLTSIRDGSIESYIVDTYQTAGQVDRALQVCNEALDAFPGNGQLRLQRADLIAEQGRVDAALELLQAMAAAEENNFGVYSTMFSIHERTKDYDGAEEVLDEMLERFENREEVYFLQGALHEKQRQYEDAETAFRMALDINADNPAVLNYLGYMLANNNSKLEEALAMIEVAVAADPINGAYLDSLGWAYYRLDKLELAERFLERAVIFSPKDPNLHDHLGDLYLLTGRSTEARASYERSLELAEDPEERTAVQKKLNGL
jgi:pentatricopeptide repeat protein